MKLSAIILAGGQSQRMGRDKAWVEYDGCPLIRLALDKIRQLGVTEVFISGRAEGDYSALGCPVLLDPQPGLGPLGGIERGLHHCASPLLLVLAVDLPHMTSGFLRTLVSRCSAAIGVVPQLRDQLEPLAAVYPKRCHGFAFQRILHGSRAAHDFASDCLREQAVKRWQVPASDAPCFENWNRPEDMGKQTPV